MPEPKEKWKKQTRHEAKWNKWQKWCEQENAKKRREITIWRKKNAQCYHFNTLNLFHFLFWLYISIPSFCIYKYLTFSVWLSRELREIAPFRILLAFFFLLPSFFFYFATRVESLKHSPYDTPDAVAHETRRQMMETEIPSHKKQFVCSRRTGEHVYETFVCCNVFVSE